MKKTALLVFLQITHELGYDGGSFFSPDGKRLIFRASRPKTQEEIDTYKALLSYNLVAPTKMELFYVNIDGTNLTQVFDVGRLNVGRSRISEAPTGLPTT